MSTTLKKKTYVCCQCNMVSTESRKFYKTNSLLYIGTGYIPICKECFSKLYNDYIGINNDERNAMLRLCMAFDIYFDDKLFDKCFEELHKHSKFKFDVCYVVMNPGYNEVNLKKIEENSKKLNLDNDNPLKSFMDDILVMHANMGGFPSLSMPVGFNHEHLPIGLQIIGNFEEKTTRHILSEFMGDDNYLKNI